MSDFIADMKRYIVKENLIRFAPFLAIVLFMFFIIFAHNNGIFGFNSPLINRSNDGRMIRVSVDKSPVHVSVLDTTNTTMRAVFVSGSEEPYFFISADPYHDYNVLLSYPEDGTEARATLISGQWREK